MMRAIEKIPMGEVKNIVRCGSRAQEPQQTVHYMLLMGELEEIEARIRRGERVQGGDGLLLKTMRSAMAEAQREPA